MRKQSTFGLKNIIDYGATIVYYKELRFQNMPRCSRAKVAYYPSKLYTIKEEEETDLEKTKTDVEKTETELEKKD